MSWEKPNLLPIWEAQVCGSMRKCEGRNVISADCFLEVRGFLQRCPGGARSLSRKREFLPMAIYRSSLIPSSRPRRVCARSRPIYLMELKLML
jgi:hypothetical protein